MDQARQRLLAQVHRDGLHAAVAGSFTRRREAHRRGQGCGNRPEADRAHPSQLPQWRRHVIPLRWYYQFPFDDRFPVVDANLGLQRRNQDQSAGLHRIYGQDRPGQHQRRAGRRRATIRRFLERLHTILTAVPTCERGCSPMRVQMNASPTTTPTCRRVIVGHQDDSFDREHRRVERRDESAGGAGRPHGLKKAACQPLPGQRFPRVREPPATTSIPQSARDAILTGRLRRGRAR